MDPDPDPRKEFEVDPDPALDPEWGSKWIRIRPNVVDPGGSGSGSETLLCTLVHIYGKCINPNFLSNLTSRGLAMEVESFGLEAKVPFFKCL